MKVSEIEIGETYNGVKVLEDLGCYREKSTNRFYRCICPKCGNEFELKAYSIGKTGKCFNCYSENLTGQRFGRLTVIEKIGTYRGHSYWRCKCDCGNYTNVEAGNLKSGGVKSCRCLLTNNPERIQTVRKAIRKKRCKIVSENFQFSEALSKHPLYGSWESMIGRCYRPSNSYFHRYGARGIKVCDRWQGEKGFENFVNDMGEKPSRHHSLDRINGDGDYCPENCRWATQKTQMNNICRNSVVVFRGERMTVTRFCELSGLSRHVVYKPLQDGVDINFIVLNSNKYRKGKRQFRDGHINHNRVVSEEVSNLLENKTRITAQQ